MNADGSECAERCYEHTQHPRVKEADAVEVSVDIATMSAQVSVTEKFAKQETDHQKQESDSSNSQEYGKSRETNRKGHPTSLPKPSAWISARSFEVQSRCSLRGPHSRSRPARSQGDVFTPVYSDDDCRPFI